MCQTLPRGLGMACGFANRNGIDELRGHLPRWVQWTQMSRRFRTERVGKMGDTLSSGWKFQKAAACVAELGSQTGTALSLRICFQTDRGLCAVTNWWWEGRNEGLETWKEPAEAAASYLLSTRQSWDSGVADVEEGGKLSVSLLIVSQKTEPSAESDTPGILADFMSTWHRLESP